MFFATRSRIQGIHTDKISDYVSSTLNGSKHINYFMPIHKDLCSNMKQSYSCTTVKMERKNDGWEGGGVYATLIRFGQS